VPPVPGGVTASATVPEPLHGTRLDAAAARLFDGHSRARLQRWIAQGCLSLNGTVVTVARHPVHAGDALELRAALPEPSALAAEAIALEVVFEDRELAVINKPSGLTVHPGAGRPGRTLQNALLHRYPEARALPRSGLVHRLDRETSGLLVVARTATAHARLVAAMQSRQIRREYDALVAGVLPAGGTVDAPIGRHPRERTRMAVVQTGRPAVTHYRVVQRFARHTLIRVRLETGRTHQIRVHMAHIRHPVVGDPVYGGRVVRGTGLPEALRRQIASFPRQALHARELEFEHPVSGKRLTFSAPPPQDFQSLVAALRKHARG
jgi:23S rRNA pseudouridine1911/1915/1917 synthase